MMVASFFPSDIIRIKTTIHYVLSGPWWRYQDHRNSLFSCEIDMISGSFLFSVHLFSMYILVDIPGWQCCTNFHARVQLGLFPSRAAKIYKTYIPESSSPVWWNSCPHKKKQQKQPDFSGPGNLDTGLKRVYRWKMEGRLRTWVCGKTWCGFATMDWILPYI